MPALPSVNVDPPVDLSTQTSEGSRPRLKPDIADGLIARAQTFSFSTAGSAEQADSKPPGMIMADSVEHTRLLAEMARDLDLPCVCRGARMHGRH